MGNPLSFVILFSCYKENDFFLEIFNNNFNERKYLYYKSKKDVNYRILIYL